MTYHDSADWLMTHEVSTAHRCSNLLDPCSSWSPRYTESHEIRPWCKRWIFLGKDTKQHSCLLNLIHWNATRRFSPWYHWMVSFWDVVSWSCVSFAVFGWVFCQFPYVWEGHCYIFNPTPGPSGSRSTLLYRGLSYWAGNLSEKPWNPRKDLDRNFQL